MKLKILRKCRLYQYLSIDTKQDPPFFSLDSTFKQTFVNHIFELWLVGRRQEHHIFLNL